MKFSEYESVIGFECHVQLKTKSKLFSRAKNQYGQEPNTLIDAVDIGLPGSLPVLNKEAVLFAIKLGVALNCTIRNESIFARKHYFYPDLPKGYQISQYDKPICENGFLDILINDKIKRINIRRIHIEEDAGKNIHLENSQFSYVDYNRSGTPLLEVVTEPDLRTPEEAIEAFKRLRQIVVSLGICDGNMQEGSLRADANVSVRKKGDMALGTRTETKNLNSFKYLGQAITFETRRQIIELENGKKIIQETRGFDPNLKETRSLRSKEEAMDYRYFPDPDLPALRISDDLISNIRKKSPELPLEKMLRYQKEYLLSRYDAELLTDDFFISAYFEEALSYHNNPKILANWITNELLKSQKEKEDEEKHFSPPISARILADLVKLIDDNIISSSIAKKVFYILKENPKKNILDIIKENNWQLENNTDELVKLVEKILTENPTEVILYKEGKTKVFGFLMGQLMKQAKGKASPEMASDLMLKALQK